MKLKISCTVISDEDKNELNKIYDKTGTLYPLTNGSMVRYVMINNKKTDCKTIEELLNEIHKECDSTKESNVVLTLSEWTELEKNQTITENTVDNNKTIEIKDKTNKFKKGTNKK